MNRAMTAFVTLFIFYSLQANAYKCEKISGALGHPQLTPISLTDSADSKVGYTNTDDGTKIRVLVSPVTAHTLMSEGTAPLIGFSVTLGIVNAKSRTGSDTIASSIGELAKPSPTPVTLKVSVLGKVGEKSWVEVQCQDE